MNNKNDLAERKKVARPWKLISMELDLYAEHIGEYFEKKLGMEIKRARHKKAQGRLKKTKICKLVNKILGTGSERKLVVYGSGGYHHFTYGLCKHADRISEEYGYIHFDHHSDSDKGGDKSLDCGSFVLDILEDTNASAICYIGRYECQPNRKGVDEKELRERKGFEKLESILASLPQDVYTSFDLDVMHPFLIETNFRQGNLEVEELMRCLHLIKETKHIIGADVLGYAGNYNDSGKKLYAQIVCSLLKS